VTISTESVRSMTAGGVVGRAGLEVTGKGVLTGDRAGEGKQGGLGGARVQWRPKPQGGGGIQQW